MSVAFNYINKNDKLMICVLALEIEGMLTFEQKNPLFINLFLSPGSSVFGLSRPILPYLSLSSPMELASMDTFEFPSYDCSINAQCRVNCCFYISDRARLAVT